MIKKSLPLPFYLTVLFLWSSISFAQQADRIDMAHLTESVREILSRVPEAESLHSPPLELTTEEADLVMAFTNLDAEIDEVAYAGTLNPDEDCPEPEVFLIAEQQAELRSRIEDDRSMRFFFSMTYSDQDNTNQNINDFLDRTTYSSFVRMSQEVDGNGLPPRGFNQLVDQFNSQSDQNFNEMTVSERAEALRAYIQETYGLEVPESYLIEDALRAEIIANPDNWRQTIGSLSEDLDFDEKIRIAARMGETFLGNYNYARAGDSDGRAVTIEELLEAAANGEPGGVCRDIFLAQSQILQEWV